MRSIYKGVYFANGGFTEESGEKMLAENGADAIVYGKSFLANPNLLKRFEKDAELNTPDQSTFTHRVKKATPIIRVWNNQQSIDRIAG